MSGWRSLSGSADMGRPLTSLAVRVYRGKSASLRALGALLVRQTKLELSRPGTGRLYSRGRTASGRARKPHRASAPGQPPAPDTSQLRNSIAMEEGPDNIRVGTGEEKAPGLEFGTKGPEFTGGHIDPRPFMRPALAAVLSQWRTRIVAEFQRATGGSR